MTQTPGPKKYDLEERTAKFGEDIIRFCKKIPRSPITDPPINQLVKSATSVGANYSEAATLPELKDEARTLWQEAKELNLIFNSIYKKVRI